MKSANAIEPTIEVSGLEKSFRDLQVLKDLNLRIRPGEIFGFVGANGAGKTTTMRIILGVLSADAGTVRFGGQPIDAHLRNQIGYLPEERGLYPKMKVREQLLYLTQLHGVSAAKTQKSVDYWLDRLGIANRGKDTVEKLSLGNQQRVQLSAALAHDPKALVLDEPFSGLDPLAVDEMSNALREKSTAGAPVMFSSHQLSLVEDYCDVVGIIKDGTMIACDTVERLRSTSPTRMSLTVDPAAVTAVTQEEGNLGIKIDKIEHLDSEYQRIEVNLEPNFNPETAFRPERHTKVDNLKNTLARMAADAGKLTELSPIFPQLSEIYRDAISDDTSADTTDATNTNDEGTAD